MSELMIILVTSASALMTAIITAFMSSRLTNFRLEKLEAKMDLHNNYMQRLALVEEKALMAHKSISDLTNKMLSCRFYNGNKDNE